ncbi:MAG: response regulator, partial [Mucilaginibacter sp.]
SQEEFSEINGRLNKEVNLREFSIKKLKRTLRNLKTDVSDQMEEENDDLLEIVDILNSEIQKRREAEQLLIKAKEEAEKSSNAKSEFLSIMSHEIRTPLNAVIGMGHLLLKSNPRPDQCDNLKVLKISADNLLVLINDILDFNKIESGKLDLEETNFSLRKLVGDIVAANLNTSNEKENSVTLELDENLPDYFISDPLRIGQVLNNLVSNAIKFTHKGNVRIAVSVKKIGLETAVIDFSVEDTGLGIAAKNLKNIFLPFMQASTSITRQFGGTGLGLAITKRILNLLHSDLKVESELGLGSRFYFTLELKTVDLARSYFEVDEKFEVDLQNKRILLVEDTLFNIIYGTQLLEGWNLRVDVAENGQLAVDSLMQKEYDLVLMDLQMPIMDGYTATVKIREFNKKTPVIALTASATSNVREKVILAGMQDYITKPFNPDHLLQKLKKYLS